MNNISASTLATELSEDPEVAWYASGTGIFGLIVHAFTVLLGLPGNCLILRVYWTKTRKTSTHVLIMALAWADLAVCLLRVPKIVFMAVNWAIGTKTTADLVWPVSNMVIAISFAFTGVIAMDRYDCICRPQRRVFTNRQSKMAALAALLISFAAVSPSFIIVFQYSLTCEILLCIFYIIFSVAVLLVIVVCYGKVYVTIRKHVTVGVVPPRPTMRIDDNVERLDNRRPTNRTPPIAAISAVVDEAVSTFKNLPRTRSTSHTKSNRTEEKARDEFSPNQSDSPGNGDGEKQSRPTTTQLETHLSAVSSVSAPHRRDQLSSEKDNSLIPVRALWTQQSSGEQASVETHGPIVDKAVSKFISQPSTHHITNPSKIHTEITEESLSDVASSDFSKRNNTKPSKCLDQLTKQKRQGGPASADLGAVETDKNARQAPCQGEGHNPQRVGAAVLQRKTTRMLFITSVVYLLTWLPNLIDTSARLASLGGGRIHLEVLFFKVIHEMRVVLVVNNAFNPLIYGLANRRFRKDCHEVLSKIRLC